MVALALATTTTARSSSFNSWLTCIASAIYWEARGEPQRGRIAVGKVVMNRVLDSRWPDDACRVVLQPYQFTWTATKPLYWDRQSLEDARLSLVGSSFRATHFHSGPPPRWASGLRYVTTIGNHHFYK